MKAKYLSGRDIKLMTPCSSGGDIEVGSRMGRDLDGAPLME